MKKALLILAVALSLAVLAPSTKATSLLPEPCLRSTLCSGLLELYEFEEASDSARFGVFMGQLHEPVAQNVAAAAGKTDGTVTGNAVDFTNSVNSYLWANGGGGLPTTTGFWFWLDTVPADGGPVSILDRYDGKRAGPRIMAYFVDATHYKLCQNIYSIEQIAMIQTCSAGAGYTTGGWNYFMFGVAPKKNADGVVTGIAGWVSVAGAAKTFGADIGFRIHPGSWQIRIGAGNCGDGPDAAGCNPMDGRIDQLAFWGKELIDSDIALLVPSGNRRTYPFVTE